MQIQLISICAKMPDWINKGFNEYTQRLKSAGIFFDLKEINLQRRSDKNQISQARAKESTQVLNLIDKNDYVIALDESGKEYSSLELANKFQQWQELGKNISFIIGAPEGLTEELKNRANEFWSLSKLTFPHPLVRVILAESLYRAWSINKNLPYHRE